MSLVGDSPTVRNPTRTRAPSLIVGEVAHERFRPAQHRFTYPLFCVRLPLEALTATDAVLPINRSGWLSFQEADHGARDGKSLQQWIDDLLRQRGVIHASESASVELVTFPRMFGFVFNPVSFWICRRHDDSVFAVLAEVNNTFGESHRYLLAARPGTSLQSGETLHAQKLLHVSPFNEVEGRYEFRFNFSQERWLARIDYYDTEGESTLLHTHISGEAKPLTRSNLRRAALRFPLQSLAVVARIHWHALLLWTKGVPFFGKLTSKQTGVSQT